jgi:dTDP-4-amino-4,6-dideoxy-D-glucose ammonia-lyase
LHTLGIVGGGRWANIVNRVASNNNTTTQIYSSRNNEISTVNSLTDITASHVWVCNYPADHYAAAHDLLLQDKHVLVEKPFVQTVEQAQELIELAQQRNLKLIVGYEFEYSSRIGEIVQQIDNPKMIQITWASENHTVRHNQQYVSDPTISVFADITPHVMTIVCKLLGNYKPELKSIEQQEHGVVYEFMYNNTRVAVTLSRNANTERTLIVDDKVYDFSEDDGRSLDRQLLEFLTGTSTVNSAANTVWIDEFIAQGLIQLRKQHLDIIRFKKLVNRKDIVANYVSKQLIDSNLVKSIYEVDVLNMWLNATIDIIDSYSDYPFVTQEELAKRTKLEKTQLLRLNKVLRNSDFVQECITQDIRNAQYWQNTIIPLNQSGTIDRVLKNEYGYPLRVGLHIGQSCMFWCTFCGRNMEDNSYYDRRKIVDTSKHVINVLRTAPNNDPYRFYLSGGLETLTNPHLMDMINAGADRGFKLSLYTNAYMLTDAYVKKNPDIWRLEVLRISLYGSSSQVYEDVTKHPKGFERVQQNAIDFLRAKGDGNRNTRFGFNYVVLPGYEEDVLAVLDLIEKINRAAGYQMNFLTLRENFRQPTDPDTFGNRSKLKQVFQLVEERRRSPWLNELHIDYGYALNALSYGIDAPTMHCITEKEMRPKGFPQVDLVVDAYGLVYLYREAGFLDRANNNRYIIGQVDDNTTLEDVVRKWIDSGNPIDVQQGDTEFMDSYEHIISLIVNQNENDAKFGIPVSEGPIQGKLTENEKAVSIQAFYQGDRNARVVG